VKAKTSAARVSKRNMDRGPPVVAGKFRVGRRMFP
jgi:hypothetical protein